MFRHFGIVPALLFVIGAAAAYLYAIWALAQLAAFVLVAVQ